MSIDEPRDSPGSSGSEELRPDELRSLVERSQRGDKEAFAELVERHRRVASAKAYGYLGDVHWTADSLQESFLKAWQKIGTLRQPERFSGWFLAIVQRTSLDLQRRRTRQSGREYGWEELPPEDSTPNAESRDDSLIEDERGERIRSALAALPPEYREVIILKHAEGRSYREIARLLRTTVKAVESRLFRARQMLGKQLESGRSEDSHPGEAPRPADEEDDAGPTGDGEDRTA